MNKEELEAQIKALQDRLDEIDHAFQVGDEYYTSSGLAVIQEFFTEDGIDKVRCVFKQLDHQTEQVETGHEVLGSLPITAFKQRIESYHASQKQREVIESRKFRRGGKS